MLRYLNSGPRDYRRRLRSIGCRKNWEFQAVLAGRCAAVLRDQGEPRYRSSTLWVFPPETPHDWTTPPDESCSIVVMHFSRVPDAIRRAVSEHGMLEAALTEDDVRRIRELHERVEVSFRRLTDHSEVVFDHAMLELSLMAIRDVAPRMIGASEGYARGKVEQALAWYAEHMATGAGVAAVAKAVYVSPPHLRRLFHQATGAGPLAAMQRLRLDRAKHLMATTDLPLNEIATATGFASASVFSRTFSRVERLPPRSWRERSSQRHRG